MNIKSIFIVLIRNVSCPDTLLTHALLSSLVSVFEETFYFILLARNCSLLRLIELYIDINIPETYTPCRNAIASRILAIEISMYYPIKPEKLCTIANVIHAYYSFRFKQQPVPDVFSTFFLLFIVSSNTSLCCVYYRK